MSFGSVKYIFVMTIRTLHLANLRLSLLYNSLVFFLQFVPVRRTVLDMSYV